MYYTPLLPLSAKLYLSDMPKRLNKTSIRKSKAKTVSKSAESYKSLFYGALTVVILFVIGFSLVRFLVNRPKPEIDNQAVSITNIEKVAKNPQEQQRTYVVKSSESLWDIAETEYHDGYKWTLIAQANHLANPDTIFKDDTLVIPAVSSTPTMSQNTQPPTPTQNSKSTPNTQDKIAGDSYTVKSGDDLWNIAVRSYGDGYQWVKIAQANNLSDPSLIFSDNVLKIPR